MKTTAYLGLLIIILVVQWLYSLNNQTALLTNPVITFGLISLGAYLSAFTGGRSRVMIPRYYSVLYLGFAGGIFMGAGFVLAGLPQLPNSLNMVQGVFYWLSFLLPKGFIYLGGMLAGGGTAVLLQKLVFPNIRFAVITDHLQCRISTYGRYLFLFLGVVVVIITALYIGIAGNSAANLIGVLLALSSGFLLERNRLCMAMMMKELYYTKSRVSLFKMIIIVATLSVIWLVLKIEKPVDPSTGNWLTIIGAFLMGFGFIIADGCYMGSLWKTGQGSISSLAAITGIFLGVGISTAVVASEPFAKNHMIQSQNADWPYFVLKFGIALLLLSWVGAYFVETPQKVVKRGSNKVWLFSEAAFIANLFLSSFGPKTALPEGVVLGGAVIFSLGVGLYIWARIVLGQFWGVAVVLRVGHKVVTQGPYKFIKHPIYWAVACGLVGLSLLLQNLWGLGWTICFVVPTLYFRAKAEEELLGGIPRI